jgi:hypothetical protein
MAELTMTTVHKKASASGKKKDSPVKKSASKAKAKAEKKPKQAKATCSNCVSHDKAREKTRIPQKYLDKLNDTNGLKIDWDHIAKEEGGHQVKAYIPWAPCMKGNHSGVSVGTGIDIGQVGKNELKKRINNYKSEDIGIEMSKKEREDLYKKLDPYIGLKQQAACDYLKAHPLELTEKEADFLTMEGKSHHLDRTKDQFENVNKTNKKARQFADLSKEEQSTLLSLEFNRGNLTKEPQINVATNIGSSDQKGAIDAFKPKDNARLKHEQAYLKASYPSPVPAATPTAQPSPILKPLAGQTLAPVARPATSVTPITTPTTATPTVQPPPTVKPFAATMPTPTPNATANPDLTPKLSTSSAFPPKS